MSRKRAERADVQERTELMRELAAALTAADFHLGRYRTDDASRVDAAARRLEEAAAETRPYRTAGAAKRRGAADAAGRRRACDVDA